MSDLVFTAMKAVQMMIGNDISPELVIVSDPGSSGARVFLVRHSHNNRTYAVKCVRSSRVSLMEETARRKIIEPFLSDHLNRILSIQHIGEYEVMISECKGKHSLHSLIINSLMPQSQLKGIWQEVVKTLIEMWKQTRHYPFMDKLCPRYHKTRSQRITDGVYALKMDGIKISDCASMPTIINGEEFPSIQETLPQMASVTSPKFGITCHGDPQPSNVVVGQDHDWSLVDWEWSGKHHDWRAMISHFYGWWPTRCITLLSVPQVKIDRGRLCIDYSLFLPPHLAKYQREAVSAYRNMSESVDCSSIDVTDINRYLATLYFGELRFLRLWNRESYLAPFLAEAIKISTYIMGSHRPQISSPFIFDP